MWLASLKLFAGDGSGEGVSARAPAFGPVQRIACGRANDATWDGPMVLLGADPSCWELLAAGAAAPSQALASPPIGLQQQSVY